MKDKKKDEKCVCVLTLNKKTQVSEIIQKLLMETKGSLIFQRSELEKAIMECRGCDKRTLKNWWRYLWMLGYFTQPRQAIFQLETKRLLELELEREPITQAHLPLSTHTQIPTTTKQKENNER